MKKLLFPIFFCLTVTVVSAQAVTKLNGTIATNLVAEASVTGPPPSIRHREQIAQQAPAAKQPSFPSASSFAQSKITAKLIPSEAKTWGYGIYVNGERFIHQPSKPGLPGNRGFDTKAKAQKVAELIIKKMKKGEMPPSVSIAEMKELNTL